MEAPVLPIKVQTPFPKLKSFLSAAIIFSYLGYEDEIKALLQLLSHKTGLYYQKHQKTLEAFLVKFNGCTANQLIEFGDFSKKWDCSFPSNAKIEENPRIRMFDRSKDKKATQFKLSSINISQYQKEGALKGIQLELSDG